MEICFDSLMTRALDEPDSIYGLIAESVTMSETATASTSRCARRRAFMTARR